MTARLLLLTALLLTISLPASAQRVVEGALPEPTTEPVPHVAPSPAPPPAPAPSREELRAALAERRATHLAELRRYVEAGVFPINDVQAGYLNVFMDPSGHLCAVANLMAFDGERPMVEATAASSNFIRLVDVRDGALYEWILASGFTQEEIGQIQEPYFFQEPQVELEQQQRQLDQERQRLQRTLNRVIARLEREGGRSLDVAVDRLIAAHAA